MPDNVYAYTPNCGPNTPTTAPVEVALTGMDPVIPRRFTVTVPSGHSGLTGIALAFGHTAVLPANNGGYITGDDWTFVFDLSGYPAGVSWSVFMCNLDLQSHAWQVIFEGDTLTDPSLGVAPQPIPTGALAAVQATTSGP